MLVKRGCDDVTVEARVRHNVVKLSSEYYIDNIPGYGRLYVEALNVLIEYGIVKDLIVFVDGIGDKFSTIVNKYLTVSIPHRQ